MSDLPYEFVVFRRFRSDENRLGIALKSSGSCMGRKKMFGEGLEVYL
jgi:hypothetical protein